LAGVEALGRLSGLIVGFEGGTGRPLLDGDGEVAAFGIDADEAGVMFVGVDGVDGGVGFVEAEVGIEVGEGFEEE
jgi:hypothetical protein